MPNRLQRDAEYFRKKGLIKGLAGSAAETGRQVAASTNQYLNVRPFLEAGSRVINKTGDLTMQAYGLRNKAVSNLLLGTETTGRIQATGQTAKAVGQSVNQRAPATMPTSLDNRLLTNSLKASRADLEGATNIPINFSGPVTSRVGDFTPSAPTSVATAEGFTTDTRTLPNFNPQQVQAATPTAEEVAQKLPGTPVSNLNRTGFILGKLGQAAMGQFQEHGLAQLGGVAAELNRRNIVNTFTSDVLAGKEPDPKALSFLSPEERVAAQQEAENVKDRQAQRTKLETDTSLAKEKLAFDREKFAETKRQAGVAEGQAERQIGTQEETAASLSGYREAMVKFYGAQADKITGDLESSGLPSVTLDQLWDLAMAAGDNQPDEAVRQWNILVQQNYPQLAASLTLPEVAGGAVDEFDDF